MLINIPKSGNNTKKSKNVEKTMETILEAFGKKIDSDNIEFYKKITGDKTIKCSDGPEDYWYQVIYSFDKFVNGQLSAEVSDNDSVKFIYKNYRFIENHFSYFIKKHEGAACSIDKTRTIIRALLAFFKDGKEIAFDYDQEYTFHLPKHIFKTHDRIVGFFDGIVGLYHGNPKKYLVAMLILAMENYEN